MHDPIPTPPGRCPKLTELADHCMNGACNPYALIKTLGDRLSELQFAEVKNHPAVKVILGQLSFLCGESLGPSFEAIQAYEGWRKTT